MIYLILEGHSYKYEIEEFIRAYYIKHDIEICESFGEIKAEDICIKNVFNSSDKYYFDMTLKDGAGNALEDSFSIDKQSTLSQNDKKLIKNSLKKQLYRILSKYTGRKLPWGTLTGIRPTSIAREYIIGGEDKSQVIKSFDENYCLDAGRAQLLYDIALKEQDVLKRTPYNSVSLYIGIPFCPSRCLYCSFISQMSSKNSKIMDEYVEALMKEIEYASKLLKEHNKIVQTIYIGGGTPTALAPYLLQKLMESIRDNISSDKLEEYTIEAGRPDSINPEKLAIAKSLGANRISVNPQTMNDETLKLIGRNHTADDVIRAFRMAREAGFDDINCDIIMGLPSETIEMFKYTVDKVLMLSPDSITLHSLAIKRASRLNELENYQLTKDEDINEMNELVFTATAQKGMYPYYMYRQKNISGNLGNTGFCMPSKECIYNIQIMEEKQNILALGAGGISKFIYPNENRLERVANVKTAEEYITRIDEMIDRKRKYIQTHGW